MVSSNYISASIEKPLQLSNEDIKQLEDILEVYPYFQTAHLLHAKALKNSDSIKFEKVLPLKAVYVSDREKLYDLIQLKNAESDISTEVTEEIKTSQSTTQKVVEKEVTEPIKENKKQDIISDFVKKEKQKSEIEYDVEKDIKKLEENYISSVESVGYFDEAKEEISKEELQSLIKEKPQKENLPSKQTFSEWLDLFTEKTKSKESKSFREPEKPVEIKPSVKKEFYNPAKMAQKSVEENDEIITETLAKIYVMQNKIDKAIAAYKKLSLKIPEKSSYFAAQILILKKKTD